MASPPPVIPIGDRSCNAPLGEKGSPLSETRLVWPAVLSLSTQLPSVFHGWSLNTVSPLGSLGQPDGGGGGGRAVTVRLAVPLTLPLVAVIVDVPASNPVTTPLSEIPAIVGALELHVTAPVTTLPLASFSTALNACVAPTAIDALAGLTVTLATGATVTVRLAVPLTLPLVAVIVVVPATSPVTTPVREIPAIVGALDFHVTDPLTTFPAASLSTVLYACVAPTAIDAFAGLTVTLATGATVTVRLAVPLTLPL